MDTSSFASTAPANTLPGALTRFVGRQQELAEIMQLLMTARLLTLTGAGGVGKTRLAVETARTLQGAYRDGIWLIELAPLADPALVPATIAQTFGLQEHPGWSVAEALVQALRARRLLLVLDTCEHLIDACAWLAEVLLLNCPDLTILATSREPLGINGEVAWRVPSLSIPGHQEAVVAEDLLNYEAVRLFVDRAAAARRDFALTAANAAAIAHICHRLDGIPLALELAAARVAALTPDQIAARLDDRFRLLSGGRRTAPPRQQTLRATIDWSHDLLTEPERIVFRRLAVFAGGFMLEAAETICASQELRHGEVFEVLLRLVDKSLLHVEEYDAVARYRLLDTIQQYACERLAEHGEDKAVQERHATYYLAEAEAAAPHMMVYGTKWLERMERDHANLRAALRWFLDTGSAAEALRLAQALANFWAVRKRLREGRAWLAQSLAGDMRARQTPDPTAQLTRAQACHSVGKLAVLQGDLDLAGALFEANLPFYEATDNRWERAHTAWWLGFVVYFQGDYVTARAHAETCLALWRGLSDPVAICWGLRLVGLVAIEQAAYETARLHLNEGLVLARSLDARYEIATILGYLGRLAYQEGQYAGARVALVESLELVPANEMNEPCRIWPLIWLGQLAITEGQHAETHKYLGEVLASMTDYGPQIFAPEALEGIAWLAAAEGQPRRALRLAGAAAALRDAMGTPLAPFWGRQFERALTTARHALDADTADVAWMAGQALTLEQTIAEVLADDPPTETRGLSAPLAISTLALPEPLTAREQEIVTLLARGLSNPQIAAELSISDRTVSTHVTHILGKLGLTGRGQVALWAVRHGLITPSRSP